MTQEKLDEMIAFFNGNLNLSVRSVARKFGMESKHCWKWLKNNGCDVGRKRHFKVKCIQSPKK